jgi:hypothetical protein
VLTARKGEEGVMGRKKKTLTYYDVKELYITQSWSIKRIAEYYDMSIPTAKRELIRMGLIVTPETPNTTKQDCKKCIYRGCSNDKTNSVSMLLTCDYILVTGHSRGCPPEHCTHCTKGQRIDQRKLRSPQKMK